MKHRFHLSMFYVCAFSKIKNIELHFMLKLHPTELMLLKNNCIKWCSFKNKSNFKTMQFFIKVPSCSLFISCTFWNKWTVTVFCKCDIHFKFRDHFKWRQVNVIVFKQCKLFPLIECLFLVIRYLSSSPAMLLHRTVYIDTLILNILHYVTIRKRVFQYSFYFWMTSIPFMHFLHLLFWCELKKKNKNHK